MGRPGGTFERGKTVKGTKVQVHIKGGGAAVAAAAAAAAVSSAERQILSAFGADRVRSGFRST